jgi:hypothetical protein
MSELNVYHHELRHNEYDEFYLKYEADKVIAELKDKLQNVSELLTETREWLIESQKMHKRCADGAIKQLRHHKYKRCLAMAMWCEFYADSLRVKRNQCRYDEAELAETYYIRCRRYRRWCKVWLELAEEEKI